MNRVGALIVFAVLCVLFLNKNNNDIKDSLIKEEDLTSIENIALTNCTNVGGETVSETKASGGHYSLCYFEDNRACEVWAMLKGDCAVGGVKTTGYDTIDQKFCAWSGGKTVAQENSNCVFKNGGTCPTIDFYNKGCLQSL